MARQMKDSGIEWIGEIPVDWSMKRVKHIFTRKNEKVMQENPTILSLARDGVKVRDISNNEGQIAESYYNYNPVEKGDLLLNPMDLYSGANCSISKVQGVISPAYINLRANAGINPTFYDYYFKVQYWLMVFFSYGKGVSYDNRWTLSAETLMNYPVVALSYEEQCKRANYLDRKCAQIDAIISKQQQIIEKLKEYKLSVITEAVTKGLDPNVPMKDSGVEWIGKIPEHWVTGKIKNFCNLKTGSTPSTSNTEWFDGMIRWFTPGDFVETFILKDSARTLSQKAKDDMVAVIVPPNTVMIVGIGATAGKIGYTMVECSCNQQITAINTNKIMPKYLMYWMIANTKFLRDTAMFTTLPTLNNQTIGNYLVMFPDDRNEEKEVVDYLDGKCDKIEILIEAKKHEIDRLHRYKKSIIYEIVTGKMEV